MNIAEKLTTIAENEQRVYNAGYEKGKAEGGSDDFFNLRTNNGQNFAYLFCVCNHLTTAPLLDTSKGIRFDYMFNGCGSLVTIPLLNVSNASSTIASSLNFIVGSCSKLENITFEGTIPKTISFNDCSKLTEASLESIITALKDLNGQTSQTITLHDTCKAKLTAEQIEMIQNKNWILA